MKDTFKIIGIGILVIGLLVGLSYGFGWIGVHQTKTIKKAQQNAERVAYEETNSFTKGKRQEAIKLYKEWKECETEEDKKAIETIVQMDFADFDEDKYITNPKLLNWIKKAKY